MKKTILLAVTLLFTGSIGFAQMRTCASQGKDMKDMQHGMMGQGGHMGKMGGGCMGCGMMAGMQGAGIPMILMHADDLKLSNDQVAKLERIKTDSMKDGIKRQSDIRIARIDLMEAMKVANPNFTEIKNTVKKISDLQTQAELAMIDAYEKGLGVLTSDQKAQFGQLVKRMPTPTGDDEGGK